MYFEDIFNKVKPLWDKSIFIGDFNNNDIELNELSKFYENYIEDSHLQKEYSAYEHWCELINWSIYVVLSTEGEKLAKKGKTHININEFFIELFEKRFRDDLQADSWEKERKEYKGFMNPLIQK